MNALLELGADPNLQDAEGMTALMEAARAPEGFEIAKAIVEAGAAIDLFSKTGVTALSMAASGGNGPVIALLLQHKADVNALHEEGSTALMAAAEMISANNGSMSIIDALLSVGADVNVARCAPGRVSDRKSGAHSPQNSARSSTSPAIQVRWAYGADGGGGPGQRQSRRKAHRSGRGHDHHRQPRRERVPYGG